MNSAVRIKRAELQRKIRKLHWCEQKDMVLQFLNRETSEGDQVYSKTLRSFLSVVITIEMSLGYGALLWGIPIRWRFMTNIPFLSRIIKSTIIIFAGI